MRLLNGVATAFSLGIGLAMIGGAPLPATAGGFQEYNPDTYDHRRHQEDLRGLVDQTQTDLRMAARLEHGNGDAHERYRNAQRHLSNFDRHLTKGHFDKDELDSAVGSIQNILDHNTLQARSRDALHEDVTQLREARAQHDIHKK